MYVDECYIRVNTVLHMYVCTYVCVGSYSKLNLILFFFSWGVIFIHNFGERK